MSENRAAQLESDAASRGKHFAKLESDAVSRKKYTAKLESDAASHSKYIAELESQIERLRRQAGPPSKMLSTPNQDNFSQANGNRMGRP